MRWSRRLSPSLGEEEAEAAGVEGAMAEERARMEPSSRLPRPRLGDGAGAIGGGGGVVGWSSSPIMDDGGGGGVGMETLAKHNHSLSLSLCVMGETEMAFVRREGEEASLLS